MKALDRNTYMQLHHESFDMLNSGSGFKTEAWRDVTGNLDLQLASIATAASNPVDAMNDRPLEELAESTGGS